MHHWIRKPLDNSKDVDVVIPMYNSIEYIDNYSKTSARLWQYFRDQIIVPLKYLSRVWRTLEVT